MSLLSMMLGTGKAEKVRRKDRERRIDEKARALEIQGQTIASGSRVLTNMAANMREDMARRALEAVTGQDKQIRGDGR